MNWLKERPFIEAPTFMSAPVHLGGRRNPLSIESLCSAMTNLSFAVILHAIYPIDSLGAFTKEEDSRGDSMLQKHLVKGSRSQNQVQLCGGIRMSTRTAINARTSSLRKYMVNIYM